ncbi:MAG TPA: PQQ-binding-like beta-propeller repeat protein [Gracilimonas sp.]|uniref:outer membrane protein assembly factor BamB family protein n=1 Tax=Gracilimonas sp. TaxID=1974203 RepID=UPI002D8FDA7F|nr:PQQ-binding-like beta-propeller repeat protein [Gracilimonas sp.]
MNYSYFITHLCLCAALLSSCELFGGGDTGPGGGEVVWKVENSTDRLVGTQPLIEEGTVYFVQDTQLKAYTLKEGKRLWSINTGNGNFSRAILSSENTLYLDEGFSIKAISKANGRMLWNNPVTPDATEFSGMGSPVMSQDKEYLYAGRRDYVLQVRKSDGAVTQRYPIDRLVPEGVSQGATEAIISPYGDGILYVSGTSFDRTTPGEERYRGNLFAFHAATGDLVWELRAEFLVDDYNTEQPGDSLLVSPPIYDMALTDSLIVLLQGFAIVAVNRSDGTIEWVHNFFDSGFDVGLAVDAEAIYAASIGTYAHKLDLTTGEELWRKDIFYSNTSIPTVQNNRLYFTNSGGGDIWVLDTSSGKVIYSKLPPGYKTDSHDIYISSLGVGEGYMVNVGSKAVYCLKVP